MADAIKKCDQLYEANRMDEAYDAIMVAGDDEKDPEVQWRIARMVFKKAEKSGVAGDKEKAITNGLERLRKNLEKAPDCPNTHKWIAILLGSKEKHDTFKQQIEEAFLIRDHLETAIKHNPSDGYAHYVLGKWCFQVASVSWYQKKVAATLFAKPPESTYSEALQHFKEAERLKPDIFSNCFLLAAKCSLFDGDKKTALPYLEKCVSMENVDAESKKNAEEARELATKNGLVIT